MLRVFVLLGVASVLSGCASLSYPLPKCDGYARRPLNRAMWQWEESGNLKRQSEAVPTAASGVTAFADEGPEPQAGPFAHLNIADSYRSCAGQG
jgi:type IV secretion system protein VirB7